MSENKEKRSKIKRTSELQVYKDTLTLTLKLYTITSEFSASAKHRLGDDICREVVKLFDYIQLANKYPEPEVRSKYLQGFIFRFERLKVRLRIAFELKEISLKKYAKLVTITENIMHQINAWRSYTLNKTM